MAIINILSKVCLILLIPFIAASPLKQPRIINGTQAILDNTKYQVSLRMKDLEESFGQGHWCGGALIAPNVVLTAAHCFYDDDIETYFSHVIYFVTMGTTNRFEKTENTVSIDVADIIYQDFQRPTYNNDLALVILEKDMPVLTNPAIELIPLNRDIIPTGTVCKVSGWGKTETQKLSDVLMTVDMPIIDRETCSTNYEEGQIQDGQICAGFMEGGKDACQGDSGGPMVSNGKLVGIISYGDDCAKPGFPGVYTNVSYYADWIDSKLATLVPVDKKKIPCTNSTLTIPGNATAPLISANMLSVSFNFLINLK